MPSALSSVVYLLFSPLSPSESVASSDLRCWKNWPVTERADELVCVALVRLKSARRMFRYASTASGESSGTEKVSEYCARKGATLSAIVVCLA